MPYLASKSYGQASGFSCCYRDHNDEASTLGQLHGSVLGFKIMFEADVLDENNRVLDTTSLGEIEEFLEASFSHTTLVAQDDPSMEAFDQLDDDGAIDLVVMPATTLEAFAKAVFDFCDHWLGRSPHDKRVTIHSVECRESEGDSAIYARDDTVIEITEDTAG